MSRIALLFVVFFSLLAGGCGSKELKLKNDLKTVGLVYHLYHDDRKQGPSGWDELIQYAKDVNMNPDAIRRVKDANYEIKWGLKLDDYEGKTSETVLGQSAKGPRLMLDGSVR